MKSLTTRIEFVDRKNTMKSMDMETPKEADPRSSQMS